MVVKLLVITPIYYPEVGGGALATYLMVDLLAKLEGLKITVLTGCKAPKRSKGVNYVYDPFLKTIDKNLYPLQLLFERYERIIRTHDVIYIMYAFPLIPIAKKLRKRTIVHLHDYRPISPFATIFAGSKKSNVNLIKNSFILSMMQKKGIKGLIKNMINIPYTMQIRRWICMADLILTVSKRHAEVVSEHMPICRNKIKVVYNPPPNLPSIRKNLEDKPLFLYVGGDNVFKGFHVLLKSLKTLGENGQRDFRVIFAGKYSLKSLEIINKLRELYKMNLEVYGMLDHDNIVKLHSKAWALLFPSIIEEPLPYAVLESILFGTLPIASRVGGVTEIVSGTIAEEFLITPGDYLALTHKILLILSYEKNTFEKYFIQTILSESKEKYYKIFYKNLEYFIVQLRGNLKYL